VSWASTQAVCGKQKFLRSHGSCTFRFHLSCLEFSETEYLLSMHPVVCHVQDIHKEGSPAQQYISNIVVLDCSYCVYLVTEYATLRILGPPLTSACFETLRSQRNDDTPVKPRSLSTSDLPKKIVSPKRALVLPPVFDSDNHEALSVQLETVRLNGVCTVDFIKAPSDQVRMSSVLKATMSRLNKKKLILKGSDDGV
jgi:hypothetical protein